MILLPYDDEYGHFDVFPAVMQGADLQACCKAQGAVEAELAAVTATSAALAAERDRLIADLAAKCAALTAADQLAAIACAELDQHRREVAHQEEAAQKVLRLLMAHLYHVYIIIRHLTCGATQKLARHAVDYFDFEPYQQ